MPSNDKNPGDAAAEKQRQQDTARAEAKADDKRTVPDKSAVKPETPSDQSGEGDSPSRAQQDAEAERRRLAADAASAEGQAAANLAANSHFTEAEAKVEVERSLASRDPDAYLHQERPLPYTVAGDATFGIPPASPQNAVDNQNTLGGASVVPQRVDAAPGIMPMPPYSPQNRTRDGGTVTTDTSVAAGLQRPLSTIVGENEGTVPMFFPRPLRLTLDDHSVVTFPGGAVSQVPEHLVDHWYLKNCGAKRV